ncbi:MAG TPA: nuclear transport factor 2 family protein [Nevskiaceae bacterium]|nr:nuclear transport factor 2 family protein [Nevskiaceae bacterium]
MRTSLLRRASAAGLLSAWSVVALAAAPTDALDHFHAAIEKGDVNKVLDLLAPEVTIYEQGFAETSRESWTANQLKDAIEFALRTDRRTLRRESRQVGDLAYVVTTTLTTGTIEGHKLELEGAETAVLRQEGGVWRIVHLHWSAHEKPPETPPAAPAK